MKNYLNALLLAVVEAVLVIAGIHWQMDRVLLGGLVCLTVFLAVLLGGTAGALAAGTDPEEIPAAIPGLDTAAGLNRMQGGKTANLAKLRQFAAGHREVPCRIRADLAAGDLADAERLTHAFKDLLGTIGASPLLQWAAQLEGAIRLGRNRETLDALVDGLEIRVADLARQIDRALPPAGAPK
jgi:HPt (histidine-containing phosphotransfer) domain-containing protein